MALVINHNLMAMNAARNFNASYSDLSVSTQRLSSGMRINSSADDAAGLAISELMRAEIAALNQGVRNAQDAQSLLQTADGALAVIDEKLIRMKELAEQSATGTYTSVQRQIMNNEFYAMRSEITRIANSTRFNGVQLLTGALSGDGLSTASGLAADINSGLKIHFGPSNNKAEDYYFIQIGNATHYGLGLTSVADTATGSGGEQIYEYSSWSGYEDIMDNEANRLAAVDGEYFHVLSQGNAQLALEAINAAIATKDQIRAGLGAYINRLSNTISQLTIQAENIQAAESRIRDADVATEMTNFVNSQIKSQAAIAMLSQANMIPQMALSLISG